ncbi:cytochrome-c peroxidase [Brevundimonas sp.]|uniref:cytochrome-c peroxidase n=1 Tax=Brevundimonas sp. TaxID=1871086 RepID=UPI002D2DF622|nr:cytochrome c peroxidase [Brevundimonas sp.]HYD26339.1 cytochrome c peroxidase [Brevundimonas sp.]
MRSLFYGLVALGLVGAASAPMPWSAEELSVLRTLWIGALETPADPSNRYADNPQAAELGRALFFDQRLSANGKVACASCHEPDHSFTDARPVGQGIGQGGRRTMPIQPATYETWQFWDGRADSLWAQALGPIENPVEHGFTRMQVAHLIQTHYGSRYEALFGPLPDLADTRRFPERASPVGDTGARSAWAAMSEADQALVNRVFANFGKAIAAYERTLDLKPTRFDDYVAGLFGEGQPVELTTDEMEGLQLFMGKGQCLQCHNGPLLTNGGFANTGVPLGGAGEDTGRAAGVRAALADPFNCDGAFSDAKAGECEELDYAVRDELTQMRAFKVPSLRGVAQRAPYMHAGQFASLEEVLDHYERAPLAPMGRSEIHPVSFNRIERRQLIAFLHTLDER